MILTTTGGLGALAETVVLLLLFVFMSTNVAVIVLRRDKVEEKHFRTPIVVPYLAIASCVLLLFQQDASTWLRAGILMAVGLVLFSARRLAKGRTLGAKARRGTDSNADRQDA